MNKQITFIDTEVGVEDKRIHDIGAVRSDGFVFHSSSLRDFAQFISNIGFVCGHNIVHHDLYYINNALNNAITIPAIDTLYLSPLLWGFSANKPPVQPGVDKKTLVNGRENLL